MSLIPPTPTTPSFPLSPPPQTTQSQPQPQPQSDPPAILLRRHLTHLRCALHPLLSIQTGHPHPSFPPTLLHYHLLTEHQLDELAHFYHQRTPSAWSLAYPAPVVTRWERVGGIEGKRRRFGRFVGLRGCDSPVEGGQGGDEMEGVETDADRGVGEERERERREWEEMRRWVERRVRRGIEEEIEREVRREKGF